MGSRRIVNVRLTRDEPLHQTSLHDESWLLSAFSSYKDSEVFAFQEDPDAASDRRQAFSKLAPKDDGSFDLELAVALPDWLPDMGKSQEYTLDVLETEGTVRRLCVSNQMTKLLYVADGEQYHAIFPKSQLWQVYGSNDLGIPADAPTASIKTVVSSRFTIRGTSAHSALETHIDDCIDRLIECLNRVAIANLTVNEDVFPGFLSPNYDRSTFDAVHFVIRGKDPKEFANWRMVTSLSLAMLRPAAQFKDEHVARVRAILSGSTKIDDVRKMMQMARSYAEGGLLEFALLQLVIAAEVATARFVHKMMFNCGVSKSKIRELKNDLTFSMMLNLNVIALSPPTMKPDPGLLGKINEARKLRNDLMHEGEFQCSKDYLRELHQNVQAYVAYLDRVLAAQGSGTTSGASVAIPTATQPVPAPEGEARPSSGNEMA